MLQKVMKQSVAILLAMAMVFSLIPLSAPTSAQAKAKYTVSKQSGNYTSRVKTTVKVKKGYKVYYTTDSKFTAKKVIKSGKKKTFTFKKTTSLKLVVVKKSQKVSKKKLNSKSFKKKAKTYKYTITKDTPSDDTQTSDPSGEDTQGYEGIEIPDEPVITAMQLVRDNYVVKTGAAIGIKPLLAGDEADIIYLSYTSSDPDVAMVDVDMMDNTIIRGVSEGTCDITIETIDGSNLSLTARVHVYDSAAVVDAADDYYESVKWTVMEEVAQAQGLSDVNEVSYGLFSDLSDKQDKKMKALTDEIEGKAFSEDYEDGTAQDAYASIYTTALPDGGSRSNAENNTRESVVLDEIASFAKQIDEAKSLDELMEVAASLEQVGVSGFLPVTPSMDPDDEASADFLLGLGNVDTFFTKSEFENASDDKYMESSLDALKHYISLSLEQAGETSNSERKANVESILKFYQDISVDIPSFDEILVELGYDPEGEDFPDDIYEQIEKYLVDLDVSQRAVDFSEVSKIGDVDVAKYLENAGAKSTSKVVLSLPAQTLTKLSSQFKEENLATLKEVLKFMMTMTYNGFTKDGYWSQGSLYSFANSNIFTSVGDSSYEGFWSQFETMAENFLPWDVSRMYTDKYYTADDKKKVSSFIDLYLDEYSKVIDQCPWMSETSKKAAQEKIDKMEVCCLYPDEAEYDSLLCGTDLDTLKDGGTLISNVEKLCKAEYAWDVSLIGSSLKNMSTWELWKAEGVTDTIVNAFYLADNNSITVPAGIVMDDVTFDFDADKGDVFNVGRLGYVVGHEIGHAFDSNGSRYDADGNERDWWSAEDKEVYQKKCDDLAALYGTYYVYDYDFDVLAYNFGEVTLGENMADISAVEVSTHMTDPSDYAKLYENEARVWVDTDPESLFLAWMDEHSSSKQRIDVVLAMFNQFYDTFGVTEENAMYVKPQNRVQIWDVLD